MGEVETDSAAQMQSTGGRYVLKKVDPLSYGKIMAIAGAVGGFFAGLIVWVIVSTVGLWTDLPEGIPGIITIMGFAAVIIYPIIYAIIGFISGVIAAFLYNIVAGWVGGIEMELGRI